MSYSEKGGEYQSKNRTGKGASSSSFSKNAASLLLFMICDKNYRIGRGELATSMERTKRCD